MLTVNNIKKTYKIGEIETKALDDISVSFRDKEFVAVLGTSGSGKTTFLNIIGGLDRYDSGDLIIKGKSTKNFTLKEWDAYRNNSIGFIFQNYNLITHLSIISNVEMGMTLSGVGKKEKRRRALELLKSVGLENHLHKKPNQLSGGQMQRVAIARALANNPEILLCDEPTGALDTKTSKEIMELIKKLSKNRLVIIVTHNPDIAKKYSTRIIEFGDGRIISDSNETKTIAYDKKFSLKKTSMSFLTALSLSFNNLKTKKGRTFLTSFASSIGIIGIAVILSLSTGFQRKIDQFQSDAMSEFPIMISSEVTQVNMKQMNEAKSNLTDSLIGNGEYADGNKLILYDALENVVNHKNNMDDKFISYVKNIDPDISHMLGYVRLTSMNTITKKGDKYEAVSLSLNLESYKDMQNMSSMKNIGLITFPTTTSDKYPSYLEKNYELLEGTYPKEVTDLILVVDTKNRLDKETYAKLGFDETKEDINFKEIIGKEYKLIYNNEFYSKTPFNTFMPNTNYENMYNSKNLSLKIVGVVRKNKSANIGLLAPGICYSDKLDEEVIKVNKESDIVKAQNISDKNVFTSVDMLPDNKSMFLSTLGSDEAPYMVMIYPKDFESKDKVLSYLDKYKEPIVYTDLAQSISAMTKNIMDGITFVLIAFAAISLIVSLIMICIITYTSVLERTKEIGVLRALGARRIDITRVFNAETCILGLFSGVLGVAITYALTFPINALIKNVSGLTGVAMLNPLHALGLIILSTVLTVIGGYIPAFIASRKDPVISLRSE
ncbi:MAG: ATP-binding cassette domain-containing protein [Bacilli bacterium]